MSLPSSNWNFPTRIWFGNGRIQDLAKACKDQGIKRPLLVTDEGLAGLDFVNEARQQLQQHELSHSFYGEVQGNPRAHHVEQAVQLCLQASCDGIIAIGGGSALDVGKCVALMAGQSIALWDLEDSGANWKRAAAEKILPTIAIPTTAGTGSEVGRAAVIVDEESRSKKIIFHPDMMPKIVISDPELSRGLPPDITAWTGVDALVHAIEAYCAPGFHPMAEGIALEAIRTIATWLPVAVSDGDNIEARGHMLVAASMAATAFQKGLGSIHSVSHVLGALYNTHHGLANAVILPYGLSHNARFIDAKMGHLCRVLGLDGQDTGSVIEFLLDLRRRLDIPHTLAELGMDEQDAVAIGQRAYLDPCTASNARPVDANDLESLFRAALTGDFTILS
ncbi:MAG: iron-containing alcohol dehydrogenase [Halieaceae bacterium]